MACFDQNRKPIPCPPGVPDGTILYSRNSVPSSQNLVPSSQDGNNTPQLSGQSFFPNTFANFDFQQNPQIPQTNYNLRNYMPNKYIDPMLDVPVDPNGNINPPANTNPFLNRFDQSGMQEKELYDATKKANSNPQSNYPSETKRKFGTPNYGAMLGFNALTTLGLGLSQRYDERRNQRGNIYSNLTANSGASTGVNYGYNKYGGMLKKFEDGGTANDGFITNKDGTVSYVADPKVGYPSVTINRYLGQNDKNGGEYETSVIVDPLNPAYNKSQTFDSFFPKYKNFSGGAKEEGKIKPFQPFGTYTSSLTTSVIDDPNEIHIPGKTGVSFYKGGRGLWGQNQTRMEPKNLNIKNNLKYGLPNYGEQGENSNDFINRMKNHSYGTYYHGHDEDVPKSVRFSHGCMSGNCDDENSFSGKLFDSLVTNKPYIAPIKNKGEMLSYTTDTEGYNNLIDDMRNKVEWDTNKQMIRKKQYGGTLRKFEDGGDMDDYQFLFGDEEDNVAPIQNTSQSEEAEERARQETIRQEKLYKRQRREKNNSFLDELNSQNNQTTFNTNPQDSNVTPGSYGAFQNGPINSSQGTYSNEELRKMFAKIENSGNTDFSKDHDGKPGGAFGPYGWMDASANKSHFRYFFDNNIGGLKTKYKDYQTYLKAAKSNGPETQFIESVFLDEMKKRNNGDLKQMAAYNLYGNLGKKLYQSGDINRSNVIGKNASIAKYINQMFKKDGGEIKDLSPVEVMALYKKGIKFKII